AVRAARWGAGTAGREPGVQAESPPRVSLGASCSSFLVAGCSASHPPAREDKLGDTPKPPAWRRPFLRSGGPVRSEGLGLVQPHAETPNVMLITVACAV